MVCESCGEKPKNTAKDFTKAVIEINNPEALVLLRKVVIPASMGDDVSVPPAIGKYHNVLLNYEANNHSYLYSSDGIPTLISSGDGGGGMTDFSLEEVDTGVKWVDGKTIYKKTIDLAGNMPSDNERRIPHGISNIDFLVKLEGAIKGTMGDYVNAFIPIPFTAVPSTSSSSIEVFVDATHVNITSRASVDVDSTGYITLYYTKE